MNEYNTAVAPEMKHRLYIIEQYEIYIQSQSTILGYLRHGIKIPKQTWFEFIKCATTVYENIQRYVVQKYPKLQRELTDSYQRLLNNCSTKNIEKYTKLVTDCYYVVGAIQIDQAIQQKPLQLDIYMKEFLAENMGDKDE